MDGGDDAPVDDATDWITEVGDVAGVVTIGHATSGAAALARDVTGLRAMRRGDAVHVTVIGHTYGSTTVAVAADQFDLAADDVVLTGSPGVGQARGADDLTTGSAHTWVGSASDDPVSYLGRTGGSEPLAGHGHYFDPCAEAAGNIGAIVAADYTAVGLAERRHKDESWDLGDPLGDLLAADPEADAPVDRGQCS